MEREAEEQQPNSVATLALYGALVLAALVLPLVLWRLNLPFVTKFEKGPYHPLTTIQLFTFSASFALVAFAVVASRKRRAKTVYALLPILLPVLVGQNFLISIRHNSARSWDYDCYEAAAMAIVQQRNPYEGCYLYWPTTAQAMAGVYQTLETGAAFARLDVVAKSEELWDIVFYFYESSQFLLILLAYFLCYRFARQAGLASLPAAILVTALFLINNPLTATLKHNQVNLWVLNLVLLAILLLPSKPFISGLAVALGGHIKLYPLILMLPWGVTRQWRALAGLLVGFATILVVQTGGGRDWSLWSQFFVFAGSFPKGQFFRDNSLHSIVYNLFTQTSYWFKLDMTPLAPAFDTIVAVITLAVFAYFLSRIALREIAYLRQMKTGEVATDDWQQANLVRMYSHALDAVAMGLIISPVVWEHHYVLAMPLIIWAVAMHGYEKPWWVAIGAFLILALPTYDVFPLSYNRIAGLILLLYVTRPTALPIHVYLRQRASMKRLDEQFLS